MLNIEILMNNSEIPFAAFLLASNAHMFMQSQAPETCFYRIKETGQFLSGTASFEELLNAAYN